MTWEARTRAQAALLSLEECRDTQRRSEGRQRVPGRFDAWWERLEAQVKAPTPPLDELTHAVFARRQALPHARTQGLVAQAHRAVVEPRPAACPQCGQPLSARGPQERSGETLVGAIRLQRPSVSCERCQGGSTPLATTLRLTKRRKLPDVQQAAVKLT